VYALPWSGQLTSAVGTDVGRTGLENCGGDAPLESVVDELFWSDRLSPSEFLMLECFLTFCGVGMLETP
jgi:hypothetical protein